MSPEVALLGAAVLAALLAAEVRLVPRLRPRLAFRLTAPLPTAPRLPALGRLPVGCGRVEGLAWQAGPDGVDFWAVPGERGAPMGLRGRLAPRVGPGGVGFGLRFSPPLALFGVAGWLAGLGAARGDVIAVPLGFGFAAFVAWWYARAAVRAAATVRGRLHAPDPP